MSTKTYICTVMTDAGNKLMEARGKKGLRSLVESSGISFDGLREFYADQGQPTQIKVEWSEQAEWDGELLIRERQFSTP